MFRRRSDPIWRLAQTYTEVSCDRAQQIDLASFVSERTGEGFAAFRKHYPLCPECSTEVRAWNELHLALVDTGGAPAHPAAEILARFEASPAALSEHARGEIESHLSVCPACRDELGALHRFDPARLSSPALKSSGPSEALGTLVGRLRDMVMHPLFAYGVALLLLYPALQGRLAPSTTIQRAEFARETDLAPAADSFGASSLRAERQTLAAEPEEAMLQAAPQRARGAQPEAAMAEAAMAEAAMAEAASPALERSPRARSVLAAPFRARFDGPVLHLELPSTRDTPAEVRVIFPEGERELLQRLDPTRSRELALELPEAWLTSGTYRVGYRGSGGTWLEVSVERVVSDAPM